MPDANCEWLIADDDGRIAAVLKTTLALARRMHEDLALGWGTYEWPELPTVIVQVVPDAPVGEPH
jgi:hypothetical protein